MRTTSCNSCKKPTGPPRIATKSNSLALALAFSFFFVALLAFFLPFLYLLIKMQVGERALQLSSHQAQRNTLRNLAETTQQEEKCCVLPCFVVFSSFIGLYNQITVLLHFSMLRIRHPHPVDHSSTDGVLIGAAVALPFSRDSCTSESCLGEALPNLFSGAFKTKASDCWT